MRFVEQVTAALAAYPATAATATAALAGVLLLWIGAQIAVDGPLPRPAATIAGATDPGGWENHLDELSALIAESAPARAVGTAVVPVVPVVVSDQADGEALPDPDADPDVCEHGLIRIGCDDCGDVIHDEGCPAAFGLGECGFPDQCALLTERRRVEFWGQLVDAVLVDEQPVDEQHELDAEAIKARWLAAYGAHPPAVLPGAGAVVVDELARRTLAPDWTDMCAPPAVPELGVAPEQFDVGPDGPVDEQDDGYHGRHHSDTVRAETPMYLMPSQLVNPRFAEHVAGRTSGAW